VLKELKDVILKFFIDYNAQKTINILSIAAVKIVFFVVSTMSVTFPMAKAGAVWKI
jgi:hypothetical protein